MRAGLCHGIPNHLGAHGKQMCFVNPQLPRNSIPISGKDRNSSILEQTHMRTTGHGTGSTG